MWYCENIKRLNNHQYQSLGHLLFHNSKKNWLLSRNTILLKIIMDQPYNGHETKSSQIF